MRDDFEKARLSHVVCFDGSKGMFRKFIWSNVGHLANTFEGSYN